MPTLYISETQMNLALNGPNDYNFFNGLSGEAFPNRLGHTGSHQDSPDSNVILNVYKGTMPSSFSAFTNYDTRASDLLISFILPVAISHSDLGTIGTGAGTTRRYIIARHPENKVATANGVATWFLITQNFSTSLTDKVAIMGTVGTPGSGADLVIPSVNITSGVNYQSLGLIINFPHGYNV